MPLPDRLRSDLTRAMKDRDQIRVRVLRSALGAIDNAGAVEVVEKSDFTIGYGDVDRQSLTEEQVTGLLHGEIEERELSVTEYERIGRTDLAESLREEIEILRTYSVV